MLENIQRAKNFDTFAESWTWTHCVNSVMGPLQYTKNIKAIYHEPRKIIKLPLDLSLLTEEEK
ncbi:unnamed protein product [Leptidea sinapis]|uniref:Uncharacterized protein n=1 Tax=Leptidea sinapis TaxID=189913 RepID=A0A5E4PXT7_9NEOP|nr:unnamed protein product [Leptidea sinapis]